MQSREVQAVVGQGSGITDTLKTSLANQAGMLWLYIGQQMLDHIRSIKSIQTKAAFSANPPDNCQVLCGTRLEGSPVCFLVHPCLPVMDAAACKVVLERCECLQCTNTTLVTKKKETEKSAPP